MGKKKASSKAPGRTVAPKPVVFVSHATYDKWIARVICEKIESLGIKTFRDDRDIEGGDSIPDTVMENIRECRELLVLLTPGSRNRQWVLFEIGMAAILKKRIIPILYHIEPGEIPGLLTGRRAFRLEDLDAYLTELKQRGK